MELKMESIKYRYRTDPAIKQLVDYLTKQIDLLQFTPSEIRECAMLAAINYELTRPARPMIIPKEYQFIDLPSPTRD
jgi:hypothetical protein